MNLKSLFILILFAVSFGAKAQHTVPANDSALTIPNSRSNPALKYIPANDTVLKGTTIEVIQSYKPKVTQAPKPEWVPQLPMTDTTHPVFTYTVPQQTLYYTYSSLPLRPLALGRDTTSLPFRNYVKAGGGNLSTLYLDAGIGSISGPGYETAIHLHDISQKGNLTDQQSSLSGIEADAFLHRDNSEWHIGLEGERNQYYDYGFQDSQSADSIKQTYTKVKVGVDMQNKADDDDEWTYHPAIDASYYGARFNTSETSFGFDVPVTYKFDPIADAQVALKGAITNYSDNSANIANNIVELLPGINIHDNQFNGHALLGLAIGKSSTYVLPDILAAFSAPGSKFIVSGGWQATLLQNTYEQLSTENPYMYSSYNVMQTRKDEVFVNIQSGSGDHLTYFGRLSWWSYDQLPTFLNDSGDQKQFEVVYDSKVNAVSLQAGARYQVANIWSVGATGDFYHFYNGSQQYVWGAPATKIKADFIISPLPKLSITAYLALMGGIYAKDISGNVVKQNMAADLGGNAEYQVIPRLSVFMQLSNLFNDKYQRWYGYQAYGLNIYGGLRLKF